MNIRYFLPPSVWLVCCSVRFSTHDLIHTLPQQFYFVLSVVGKYRIYCTKAQKIEIELEFEFYRNVFYEELSTFMDAFIQAQKIFPEDAPVGDYDEFNERDMKIAFMATGIERRSRAAMIEESEAGNEKTKTTGS